MHVLYTLSCSIPHISQLDLNPANLEAAVQCIGRINSGVSFLAKTAFSMTSSLRSVVQVLMGYFTIFHVIHGLS